MAERESNRAIGARKEELAVQYLKQQGIQVLEQNYRCRQGEIDIIAREENYLLFVEVKYRSTVQHGYPAEAVTRKKQQKIRRVAEYYQYRMQLPENTPVRFDVIAILGTEIQYIRNAF